LSGRLCLTDESSEKVIGGRLGPDREELNQPVRTDPGVVLIVSWRGNGRLEQETGVGAQTGKRKILRLTDLRCTRKITSGAKRKA
jgi:hypothetical protein